jgi:predicted HicB family RNase H-like nuclease
MTYKGYQARVDLDEEAGVFHGGVINTRDVIPGKFWCACRPKSIARS